MNILPKNAFLVLFSILLLTSSIGCSTQKKTEVTTVTESSSIHQDLDFPSTTNTTITKVSKEDSDSSQCGGILSCTFDALGAVIALPFRAVGALIGLIF